MFRKIFTSTALTIVLWLLVASDMVYVVMQMRVNRIASVKLALIEVTHLTVCVAAFVSLLFATRYSTTAIRVYLSYMILSGQYIIFTGLKDVIVYQYNHMSFETYFTGGFSALLGTGLLILTEKYEIRK